MNKLYVVSFIVAILVLSGCSTRGKGVSSRYTQGHETVNTDTKVYTDPKMKPYTVRGIRYYPKEVSVGDKFYGNASWYGPNFHGKYTANGESYNMHAATAAHKTLPMNTIVRVTNKRNGLSTVVRINDRGPFYEERIIDLSNKAAKEIDLIALGTAPVKLEILGFQTKNKLQNKVASKPTGSFALQIASFTNIEGAIRTQERYDNTDGYRTKIQDLNYNGERLFKVVLTGFKSEQEARDYKDTTQKFDKAFIIRLKKDL